jgi:hypothetical protein
MCAHGELEFRANFPCVQPDQSPASLARRRCEQVAHHAKRLAVVLNISNPSVSAHQPLRGGESAEVEAGKSPCQGIDERVQVSVANRPIDPSISFRLAKRRSQDRANSLPPPRARPLMQAIVIGLASPNDASSR